MVHHPKVRVLNNVANNNGLRTKRLPPRDSNKKSYLKILLLTVFFILGLLINGDIQPLVKRGFFCSDSSIMYPYKTDTVGIKTLMLLALVIPGLLIFYCDKKLRLRVRKNDRPGVYDLARYRLNRRRVSGPKGEVTVEEEELMTRVKRRSYCVREVSDGEANCNPDTEPINISPETSDENSNPVDRNNAISDDEEATRGSDSDDSDAEVNLFTRIPLNELTVERKRDYLKASSRFNQNKTSTNSSTTSYFGEFQLFFFGLCCTIFITGLGKITCGRLRPHFIDRCRPNVDCLLPENGNRYIEDFTCQNLMPREYPYITTSWPSGHASIIFYSMGYLILYLNSVVPIFHKLSPPHIRWRYNPIFVYMLYLFMVALAFWVSVTRVSDYHHHAIDVASGTVIGTTIAITLSRLYSCKSFL